MKTDHRFYFMLCAMLLPCIGAMECSNRSEKAPTNLETIQIDVHKAIKKYDATEMLDSLFSVIPLETNNDCLIGQIDKLEIKNNRIYVTDDMSKSVYVFDMTGKFVSKVNALGKGPGEYQSITASIVTDSTIVIVDNLSYKQLEYSFNGKFIREKRMLDKVWANDIFWYGNKIYYVNNSSEARLGKFRLFAAQLSSENIEKYLPFEKVPISLGINGPRYSVLNDGFSIIFSGIDGIFGLLPDGKIASKYTVDFMNEKAIYRSEDITKVLKDNPKGKVLGIERIFETEKYIFLHISRIGEFDILCIYNKNDKTTTLCDGNIVHPSFDEIFCQIKGVYENKIITWYEADFFKSVYENNWSKNKSLYKTMHHRLEEVDKILKEEDNLVLIICDLK